MKKIGKQQLEFKVPLIKNVVGYPESICYENENVAVWVLATNTNSLY